MRRAIFSLTSRGLTIVPNYATSIGRREKYAALARVGLHAERPLRGGHLDVSFELAPQR